MMHEALKLAESIQIGIDNVRDDDQKMRFENQLAKQCKQLEDLGDSLVFKEEEVLLSYREKLRESRQDKNPA